MKRRLGAACLLAVLVAVLCAGCGNRLSLEDHTWTMTVVFDKDGQVVACAPGQKDLYPHAEAIELHFYRRTRQTDMQPGKHHRHLPADGDQPGRQPLRAVCGGLGPGLGRLRLYKTRHGGNCSDLCGAISGTILHLFYRRINRHDKKPRRVSLQGFLSGMCDQACKPGSVVDSHLSWPDVAVRLTPPPRDARAALCVPPRCCFG